LDLRGFFLAGSRAPSDLPSASDLRSLLLSLRHIRLSKIRSGLRPSNPSLSTGTNGTSREKSDTGAFSGGGDYLKLTGLTPIEVVEMRGFLSGVMGMMRSLTDNMPEDQ
jgi:hypothetical protein